MCHASSRCHPGAPEYPAVQSCNDAPAPPLPDDSHRTEHLIRQRRWQALNSLRGQLEHPAASVLEALFATTSMGGFWEGAFESHPLHVPGAGGTDFGGLLPRRSVNELLEHATALREGESFRLEMGHAPAHAPGHAPTHGAGHEAGDAHDGGVTHLSVVPSPGSSVRGGVLVALPTAADEATRRAQARQMGADARAHHRRRFGEGWSLVVEDMQERVQAVARLCAALEASTLFPCNANAYLSPSASRAFDAHFDWMVHKFFSLFSCLCTRPRAFSRFLRLLTPAHAFPMP